MKQKGFTLIEIMMVVAIIGILAVISIDVYVDYLKKTANTACLAEAKTVNYKIISALANREPGLDVASNNFAISSCERITFTDKETDVTAYPKSPGDIGVVCPMDFSGTCRLDNTVTP